MVFSYRDRYMAVFVIKDAAENICCIFLSLA